VQDLVASLLLAFMILLCPRGWAQQDLITEIDIHGNRRIPADTVKARIFTHAGDVYDPAGLERDFNSLWNTGYFEDVRFEREQTPKGWRIHVYVKEKPTIREINYTGLSSVSTSDVSTASRSARSDYRSKANTTRHASRRPKSLSRSC